MRQLNDFADPRQKAWCIHCGVSLDVVQASRDHVPSKVLLKRPLPKNVPVVIVCAPCNTSFARDEEYLGGLLAAVLTGGADPDPELFPGPAASLRHSLGLRERILQARLCQGSLWEGPRVLWKPDIARVNNVVIKNARGHAFYEIGEPLMHPPSAVAWDPLEALTPAQRAEFERAPWPTVYPEVGSRLMQRLARQDPLARGWIEVQDRVYRYAVTQGSRGEIIVRTLVRDYLATEVVWES